MTEHKNKQGQNARNKQGQNTRNKQGQNTINKQGQNTKINKDRTQEKKRTEHKK